MASSHRNLPCEPGQGPLELVDDRQVRGGARAGERVQVDGDDAFAETLEGLGPISVLQWDDDDVGATDPSGIDPGPVGGKPRDAAGRVDAQHLRHAGRGEAASHVAGSLRGPVEEVHLDL